MAAAKKENSFEEGVLLQKLSLGSEQAFRKIYERYHAMIYRSAERFLQCPYLAQDVVQEVFSSVWTHRAEMSAVRNLEAYLRTVGKNQIYTFLRKVAYEEKQKALYEKEVESSVENSDSALLEGQNEEFLNHILSKLPARQQEVFYLSRSEGLSHDHIAERLNISQGTVKNHIVRALQTIKQELSSQLNTVLTIVIYLFLR